MGRKKKKAEPQEQTTNESRREMLQKIGLALAVTTVATNPIEAAAQTAATQTAERLRPGQRGRPVRLRGTSLTLPDTIRTAVSDEPGQLKIFFTSNRGGAASILVLRADDQEAVRLAQEQLNAAPATARVVNGVVQVNLGAAAAGRCNLSLAAAATIDFGNPPPFEVGPLTRGRLNRQ